MSIISSFFCFVLFLLLFLLLLRIVYLIRISFLFLFLFLFLYLSSVADKLKGSSPRIKKSYRCPSHLILGLGNGLNLSNSISVFKIDLAPISSCNRPSSSKGSSCRFSSLLPRLFSDVYALFSAF